MRKDIEIDAEDGMTPRGWLSSPDDVSGAAPAYPGDGRGVIYGVGERTGVLLWS